MKTASPEMFDLAPKDLPWKTGPSYIPMVSIAIIHQSLTVKWEEGPMRTLMVKVALSCEIGVALILETGIWRSVLCWTVARNRDWDPILDCSLKAFCRTIGDCLSMCRNIVNDLVSCELL